MYADKQLVDKIEKITLDISSALDRMKSIPGMYDNTIKKEIAACRSIPQQIKSEIIKIAVVGAIKSGKSTFINSWLKMDILKRGPGVITSIVTRVKRGDDLCAIVYLKSWDEINYEIEKALLFFPDLHNIANIHNTRLDTNGKWFDLRRKNDRELLKSVKKLLCQTDSVTDAGIRQEAVIINQVLDGFDTIKTMIQPESSTLIFANENFDKYKQFTGNDSLAFFVKDVEINIVNSTLDPLVEIADCQGSDSTNPSHMINIQEYLVSSSLIIYLISSRTGIRKADIKFLNIIRNMGLIDRLFFIVNIDFDEHENIRDLMAVEKRIKQDISYIKDDPIVFTISSLYNLFSSSSSSISTKEKHRFKNWKRCEDLVRYSDNMTQSFYCEIDNKLSHERNNLLVANHMEHLKIIIKNTKKRIDLFLNLLSEDLTKVNTAINSLKKMQKHAGKFDSNIKNSLYIIVEKLKSGINKASDSFFDPINGKVYQNIKSFIKNYNFDYEQYEAKFHQSGFHSAIYHMFHDFRNQFDTFITERINPEILGFIREQEQEIKRKFKELYLSHTTDPFQTSSELKQVPDLKFLISDKETYNDKYAKNFPDLKAIKGIMELVPPKVDFAAKYNARIKLDSMAGFCLHFASEIMNKIFKGKFKSQKGSGLNKAGTRIKKQTLQLMSIYLDQYNRDVKSQYFFKLINAVSRDFHDKLMDRFQMHDIEMEQIKSLVKSNKWEKETQIQILESIKKFTEQIESEIEKTLIY